jgi:hypothetical protein
MNGLTFHNAKPKVMSTEAQTKAGFCVRTSFEKTSNIVIIAKKDWIQNIQLLSFGLKSEHDITVSPPLPFEAAEKRRSTDKPKTGIVMQASISNSLIEQLYAVKSACGYPIAAFMNSDAVMNEYGLRRIIFDGDEGGEEKGA